jgi:ligand-binding sensor domain-containing protein
MLGALPASSAAHERLHLRCFSVGEGLALSSATALLQDHRGYLWVGTEGGGLDRFDGHGFVNFDRRDGLAGNHVHALVEDAEGLWIGTDSGLSLYDGEAFRNFGRDSGLPAGPVLSLAVGSHGELWAGTLRGVAQRQGERFAVLPTAREQVVTALLQDRSGALWIGTESGLLRSPTDAVRRFGAREGLAGYPVAGILEDHAGNLWLNEGGRLLRWVDDRFERIFPVDGPPGTVGPLHEAADGALWLGLTAGVGRMANGEVDTLGAERGFPRKRVQAILQDREGGLWIGTAGEGVCHHLASPFTSLTATEGLPDPLVMALAEYGAGEIWLGTAGGLARYDGQTVRELPQREFGRSIQALLRDRRGRLWIGADRGLGLWDGDELRTVPVNHLVSINGAHALAEDDTGNLWIGGVGLVRFDGRRADHFLIGGELGVRFVSAIAFDRSGTMWLGTGLGLLGYRDGKFFRPAGLDPIPANKPIVALLVDEEDALWIGTHGWGVWRFLPASPAGRRATVDSITTREGLSDDNVFFLQAAGADEIWIGTGRGVDRLDAHRYRSTGEKTLRHYGIENGFVGVETNRAAALRAGDGSLWFGTVGGAMHYRRERDREERVEWVPPVHLEAVRLSGRVVDWERRGGAAVRGVPPGFRLSHRENHLGFDYRAVSLRHPLGVRYRYRLRGADSRWSEPTRTTSVKYPSLPPGDYVFEVVALRRGGRPSGHRIELPFAIAPPWWATRWSVALEVAAVGAIVASVLRAGSRRRARRRRELEAAVELRTHELAVANERLLAVGRELADANRRLDEAGRRRERRLREQLTEAELQQLKLQLHPHFVFNALNSVSALMDADTEKARDALAGVGDLLRFSLDRLSQQKIPLGEELDFLRRYLEVQRIRYGSRLLVTLEVEPGLESAMVPSLCLQPLVENAIQHAVEPRREPTRITLSARRNGDELQVEISDDGPGTRAATTRRRSQGLGLRTTGARLNQLYGPPPGHRFEFGDRPGGGFMVWLQVPLEWAA